MFGILHLYSLNYYLIEDYLLCLVIFAAITIIKVLVLRFAVLIASSTYVELVAKHIFCQNPFQNV